MGIAKVNPGRIETVVIDHPTTIDVLGLTREEYQTVRNALFNHEYCSSRFGPFSDLSDKETEGAIAQRMCQNGGPFRFGALVESGPRDTSA